jgi:hypothetical protein
LIDVLDKIKNKKTDILPAWQNIEKLFLEGLPLAIFMIVLSVILIVIHAFLSVFGCLGGFISFILNIVYALLMPCIIVIGAFRLKELMNWKEALVIGAFAEDLQKNFKEYFPLLIASMVLSFVSAIIGCGILSPFFMFITMVAMYPLIGKVYLKNYFYESSINEKNSEEKQLDETIKAEVPEEVVEVKEENPVPQDVKESSEVKEEETPETPEVTEEKTESSEVKEEETPETPEVTEEKPETSEDGGEKNETKPE